MSSASASATAFESNTLPIHATVAEEVLTTTINATVQSVVVTFERIEGPNPHWKATASPSEFDVSFNDLIAIRWTLVIPNPNINQVTFADPPITFPVDQQAAPMVIFTDPLNAQSLSALWTNVDRNRAGTYQYTIHALVNGEAVREDPTVENQPPVGP